MSQIRHIRQHMRLTRRQLADKLRVDERTVARWETGERQPSTWTYWQLRHLARAAGVGMSQLRMELFYPDPEAI